MSALRASRHGCPKAISSKPWWPRGREGAGPGDTVEMKCTIMRRREQNGWKKVGPFGSSPPPPRFGPVSSPCPCPPQPRTRGRGKEVVVTMVVVMIMMVAVMMVVVTVDDDGDDDGSSS